MAKASIAAELRGLSRASWTKVTELKEELFTLRFQRATGQLESPRPAARGPQGHRADLHRAARARLGIGTPRIPNEETRRRCVTRERADSNASATGRRKVREGLVVSDKMDKTVVVAVEDRVKHRLYGKVLRRTARLKAHDETNEAGVGDRSGSWRPGRCPPDQALARSWRQSSFHQAPQGNRETTGAE